MHDKLSGYIQNTAKLIFLVLGPDGRIQSANRYAVEVLGSTLEGKTFTQILVDFFHLVDPDELAKEGDQEHLLSVTARNGDTMSFLFSFVRDENRTMVFGRPDISEMALMHKEIRGLNQELGNLSRELQKKNAKLQYALDHIKTLQGIIPICMHCHKIRSDKKHWHRLENYIEEHTHAEFSHSICSECLEKHYPVTDDEDDDDKSGA